MEIRVDDRQAAVLLRVLRQAISDMRFEVANTESKPMRDGLKEDIARLQEIAHELEAAGVQADAG